jgi:hypothetical protein
MKNKYITNVKISEAEFRQILRLFYLEMEADNSLRLSVKKS